MTDPLDILATPVEPVRPSEAFTARLRVRIERALTQPEGDTVNDLTPQRTETTIGPAGFPRPGALPYLSVRDARAAIDWYTRVFEGELIGEPIIMPDGAIGHAELALGGGTLYLAEAGQPALPDGAWSVSLMIPVRDTDATVSRARTAGGRIEREPYEEYGFRNASLFDPFGHRWMVAGPLLEHLAQSRLRTRM